MLHLYILLQIIYIYNLNDSTIILAFIKKAIYNFFKKIRISIHNQTKHHFFNILNILNFFRFTKVIYHLNLKQICYNYHPYNLNIRTSLISD